MSYVRFPHTEGRYATLELNQVAFPKTGMVVSQTPLGASFTAAAPCENGMWVVADKAAGAINEPTAVTDKPLGIVYTSEKEYDVFHYGLNTFGRKVAGDYPRVGILGIGDTVTTNCLQYDTGVFADEAAMDTYFADPTHVAYVLPGIDSTNITGAARAIPRIVKALPSEYAGAYAKVVKYYTVPNGEKGIKYQIISLG